MKCIPDQILIEAILALPSLRMCQLLFREVVVDLDYRLGIQNN